MVPPVLNGNGNVLVLVLLRTTGKNRLFLYFKSVTEFYAPTSDIFTGSNFNLWKSLVLYFKGISFYDTIAYKNVWFPSSKVTS